MKDKLIDVQRHLVSALEALSDTDKPMDLDRAKTMATVAQTYINGARVAVDFMKATDAQTDESGIIAAPKQVTGPQHPKIGVVK